MVPLLRKIRRVAASALLGSLGLIVWSAPEAPAQGVLPGLPDVALPVPGQLSAESWMFAGSVDADCYPDLLIGGAPGFVATVVRGGPGGQLSGFTVPTLAPWSELLLADVNGDGFDDLLAARASAASPGEIEILHADGSGGFAAPVVLPVAAVAAGLAVADLDGDGSAEILYTHEFGNRLTILSAGVATDVPVPSLPTQVLVDDLDGDGDPDLLVVASDPSGVGQALHVIWNQGALTFSSAQLVYSLSGKQLLSLATGDVPGFSNASILLDAFFFAGGPTVPPQPVDNDPRLVVFGLTGDVLDTPVELPLDDLSSSSLVAADLDGDGADDVILFHQESQSLEVQLTQGGLPTPVKTVHGLRLLTTDMAAVDWNQDGFLDVATVTFGFPGPPQLRLLLGAGDGSLSRSPGLLPGLGDYHVGDFDGDGLKDLMLVSSDGASAAISRHGAGGSWLPAFSPLLALPPTAGLQILNMVVGDLTADGLADVVTLFGAPGQSSKAYVTRAAGQGAFQPPQLIGPGTANDQSMLVGDLTGNGQVELITVSHDDASLGVVLRYLVSPSLGGSVSQAFAGSVGVDHRGLCLADVDNDGDLDLVMSVDFGLAVSLGQNSVFAPAMLSLGAPGQRQQVQSGDLDQDGFVDVVTALGSDLELWSGNGSAAFATPNLHAAGAPVVSFAVQDLDQDGATDLLVSRNVLTGPPYGEVVFWPGPGFGVATEVLGLAENPGRIQMVDINGDGSLDLLSGSVAAVHDYRLPEPWTNLGHALSGSAGLSSLQGVGSLVGGTVITLAVAGGPANAPAWMIAGFGRADLPFKGGLLVPQPQIVVPGATDAAGTWLISATLPTGLPPGNELVVQSWFSDSGGVQGAAATIAVSGLLP